MTPILLLLSVTAGASPAVNVIPRPTSIKLTSEAPFRVEGDISVFCPDRWSSDGTAVVELFRRAGAKAHMLQSTDAKIKIENDPALGPEAYRLLIHPDRIDIQVSSGVGCFYAVQTLRQLMPVGIEKRPLSGLQLPAIAITDSPAFPWRGMLMDVSRHFFTPKEIKHVLDLLAMQKMNVFHWHLVDDGGWRLQIKRYPNLTNQGAWRTPSNGVWDYRHMSFPPRGPGKRYGGFYTQDQVRDIVRYAESKHITIVPEIEMPGHSMAALESYPELACKVSDVDFEKASTMPSKNVYCAGKDSTFKFLENVLDEVFELFPSKVIHIGGDEVDKYLYNHCPDCQKRMADEHLTSAEELQSYFIKRMEKYINSKGKRIIGWDEILQGGLAPNAAVMSWRGIDGGIEAANAGHDVVMTPTSHCYFDYTYNQISTEHVLTFEPVPQALVGKDAASHVLGGQCNLWTEWVPDIATAEQRLFPRMLAMSEVLWSKDNFRDTFDGRLNAFYPRLQALGLRMYLPKPEAEFEAVMMGPDAKITFQPSPIAGAVIRYTTDGSLPTPKSPVYDAPISGAVRQTVTAATFLPGGQQSDPTRIEVASHTLDSIDNLKPGLIYSLFEGSFNKVPDFTNLKPVGSGEITQIGLVGHLLENYAVQFRGVITVPRDGVYRFSLKSDDGSMFWLGGALVVDNDGPHGAIEKSGRISLRAGSYPIAVGYYQGEGGQSLSLSVEGPALSKQPVPLEWFRH